MEFSLNDVWRHLDGLTKPPRSLGKLEELAVQLCQIQRTLRPQTVPRRLVIFAGDHGVTNAGVTIWPSAVTNLMVTNICNGGAASTVFARQAGTDVVLVNVGTVDDPNVDTSLMKPGIRYCNRRVRAGTHNMAEQPALTVAEFEAAWNIGVEVAQDAATDQVRIVIGGEMGIGNTTPASCLAMLLADIPLSQAVGRGAGADDATLDRKQSVIERAVARAREIWRNDPVAAIASVAGLEIVAMAGMFAEASRLGLTIVLDGVIAGAAALIAHHRWPAVSQSMIAAHLSTEPAHRLILDCLNLSPFLDWQLRLGEGTGGLLLLPLLDAAAAVTSEMATLESFGIRPRNSP